MTKKKYAFYLFLLGSATFVSSALLGCFAASSLFNVYGLIFIVCFQCLISLLPVRMIMRSMTDKRFKDDVIFSFISLAIAGPLISYLILSNINGGEITSKYICCYTLNQIVFNYIFTMSSYKVWYKAV